MKEKIYLISKYPYFIYFMFGLTFGIVLLTIATPSQASLYKTILLADNHWSKVSLNSVEADFYYDLASLAYEKSDYDGVITNCKFAKNHYLKESQGYKKIKSELEASEVQDKLIDIYIGSLDEIIIATDSLYEACEHFESAARYYKDNNYAMGGAEIRIMNEKIENHDESVKKYNSLIEDFGVELERRLK